MLRLDHQLALLPTSNWQPAICNQCLIHVVPAEVGVATGRKHLKDAVVQLQNRDVERAASQVVDGDFRFRLEFIKAISERGRSRLVDDPLDRESGRFARRFRGITLRVVKVRGDGDDCARDRTFEGRFGIALQLSQDESRDFLGRIFAVAHPNSQWPARLPDDLVIRRQLFGRNIVPTQANQALDRIDSRSRLQRAHAARRRADQRIAHFRKMHDRRREPRAVCVCEQDRKARFHHADERVRRPRSIPTMSSVIASGAQPRLSWQATQPGQHDLDAVSRLESQSLHERHDDEDDCEDH